MEIKEIAYAKNIFPTHLNQNKIGNLIALLANKIPDLYMTKVLKLLYVIDETSVTETGLTVTDIKYKVWIKGPVPVPIYYDLLHDDSILKNYFDVKKVPIKNSKKLRIQILPKEAVQFDDNEFSEYEMELIERIINDYGDWSTNRLINHLHKEGSAWKKVVDENGLEDLFKTDEVNVTNYPIEFADLIKDKPYQYAIYSEAAATKRF